MQVGLLLVTRNQVIMGNEFRDLAAHSAQFFGDQRDHWWHDDFIEMVGRHWRIAEVRTVLDVGCGVGHWGRVLARIMPSTAHLIGIDREELWVTKAMQRASTAGLVPRFDYRVASAESLPFKDGAFDMVTCQTVLMHVRDPERVLREMVRVTRPGGLVVAAEATSCLAGVLLDSIASGESPETTASLVHFQLVCERGKKSLGEGDSLIGESLSRLFRGAGLTGIETRLNDRGSTMSPPYESPFERALVEETLNDAERGRWVWDEVTTKRYFLAGGGREAEFAQRWRGATAHTRRSAEAMRANTYTCGGGNFFYLVWGRRRTDGETGG